MSARFAARLALAVVLRATTASAVEPAVAKDAADVRPTSSVQPTSDVRPPSTSGAPRFTKSFKPKTPGPSPLRDLLLLPQQLFGVVLSPLRPPLAWAERLRVDQRLLDALTNADRTSLLLPTISWANRDGFGLAAVYSHSNVRGNGEKLDLGVGLKQNLDHDVAAAYRERIAALEGRELSLSAGWELDHNERWWGLGPHTKHDDGRAVEVQALTANAGLELFGTHTGSTALTGELLGGVLHEWLGPGKDPSYAPVGPGDGTTLPPAFRVPTTLAQLAGRLLLDLRDSGGRTSRGWLAQGTVEVQRAVDGADVGAVRGTARVVRYFPLGGDRKVLALGAGVAAVTNVGDAIPFDAFVALGRSQQLRGYAPRRFRDHTGYFAVVEYRYPIYEYADTGVGLSGVWFLDLGSVARRLEQLVDSAPKVSPGFGLRLDTPSSLVVRTEGGVSVEGFELNVSLSEAW